MAVGFGGSIRLGRRGDGGNDWGSPSCHFLQAPVFSQYPRTIAGVGGERRRADVAFQACFDRTATPDVILEDRRADADIGDRIERGVHAAMFAEFLAMHF